MHLQPSLAQKPAAPAPDEAKPASEQCRQIPDTIDYFIGNIPLIPTSSSVGVAGALYRELLTCRVGG
jgi:hypothetical protein